jgi:hypothetical protein
VGWLEKARAAWRAHKYSFLISVLVTAAGLGLYIHTYIAESQSPLALFIRSIEAKSYDIRFRVRGHTAPAPEIVIVAIDQATLERLGSWPFSRLYYARMLDRLTADGGPDGTGGGCRCPAGRSHSAGRQRRAGLLLLP